MKLAPLTLGLGMTAMGAILSWEVKGTDNATVGTTLYIVGVALLTLSL